MRTVVMGAGIQPPNTLTGQRGPIRYPGIAMMLLILTAVGTLTYLRNYFPFGHPRPGWEGSWDGMVGCVMSYYPWALLAPLAFRLERRYPLGTGQWSRNLLCLLGSSIPISCLASPAMQAADSGMRYLLRAQPRYYGALPFLAHNLLAAETLFWCSVGGGYLIRTLMQLQEQEQNAARLALEKSQLEADLRKAQLDALRARLNPHFLFNSLQNISMLALQDPRTASRMLTRLGDLLRAVLRSDAEPETTLREEIELTQAYAAIEQMRFGDRLKVAFGVARELEPALVPRFIFQPLLENAIVHGLRGAARLGAITVEALQAGDELVLTVSDNGIGPQFAASQELKVGVGLGSTCERLERMYPGQHTFSIQRLPEGGTEVRITLPLRLKPPVAGTLCNEQITTVDRG